MGVVASVLELRSLTSLFSFSRSPASEKCVLTLVLFLWITATAAVLCCHRSRSKPYVTTVRRNELENKKTKKKEEGERMKKKKDLRSKELSRLVAVA